MRIAAFDLAVTTGFAFGEAGQIPVSGSVRLKGRGDPPEQAVMNLRCLIRDRFALERPNVVVVEHYLHPVAMKSADAVILQIMLHGVLAAETLVRDIRLEKLRMEEIRKHFCGRARAGSRDETKQMVIGSARTKGYFGFECKDDNRADACAVFDFASLKFAGVDVRSEGASFDGV